MGRVRPRPAKPRMLNRRFYRPRSELITALQTMPTPRPLTETDKVVAIPGEPFMHSSSILPGREKTAAIQIRHDSVRVRFETTPVIFRRFSAVPTESMFLSEHQKLANVNENNYFHYTMLFNYVMKTFRDKRRRLFFKRMT